MIFSESSFFLLLNSWQSLLLGPKARLVLVTTVFWRSKEQGEAVFIYYLIDDCCQTSLSQVLPYRTRDDDDDDDDDGDDDNDDNDDDNDDDDNDDDYDDDDDDNNDDDNDDDNNDDDDDDNDEDDNDDVGFWINYIIVLQSHFD